MIGIDAVSDLQYVAKYFDAVFGYLWQLVDTDEHPVFVADIMRVVRLGTCRVAQLAKETEKALAYKDYKCYEGCCRQ